MEQNKSSFQSQAGDSSTPLEDFSNTSAPDLNPNIPGAQPAHEAPPANQPHVTFSGNTTPPVQKTSGIMHVPSKKTDQVIAQESIEDPSVNYQATAKRKHFPWAKTLLSVFIVFMLLGGTAWASMSGWLPFEIPFLPKNASAAQLMLAAMENYSDLSNKQYANELRVYIEDKEADTPIPPSSFENTSDNLSLSVIVPTDLNGRLTTSGFSKKGEAEDSLQAELKLDGVLQIENETWEAAINLKTIDEKYYVQVKEFPEIPFLLPAEMLSQILGQWIEFDASLADNLPLPEEVETINQDASDLSEEEVQEQILLAAQLAYEEGVFSIAGKVQNEEIEGVSTKHMQIELDPFPLLTWYERVTQELEERYSTKALIEYDSKIAEELSDPEFQTGAQYFADAISLDLWIDNSSKELAKVLVMMKFAYSDAEDQEPNKQIVLSVSQTYADLEATQRVSAPTETITYEELLELLSGVGTSDSLDLSDDLGLSLGDGPIVPDDLHNGNVRFISDALLALKTVTGNYPESFESIDTELELATQICEDVSVENQDVYFYCFEIIGVSTALENSDTLLLDPNTGQQYLYSGDANSFSLQYEIVSSDMISLSGNREGLVVGVNTMTQDALSLEGAADQSEVSTNTNTNELDDDVVVNLDSDFDGLPDSREEIYRTDPYDSDTDDDGFTDGEEVLNGFDPLGPGRIEDSILNNSDSSNTNTIPFTSDGDEDNDSDGLTNAQEAQYGTNPANPDTDGDGFLDGEEVANGYNPNGTGRL